MEKLQRRVRGLNWNHAQTMALAELKREASLNNEDGRLVWERIAQTLSCRFPGQIKTGAQCRWRWDTLVKVYNHIEEFCVVTGAQDHLELDEGELASMKLDTAYQQDWYDVVAQVRSKRQRKGRCARDLMPAKQRKGSSPGSHSVERPPNRDTPASASTSKSVNHHEQSTPESTTTYARVSSNPSLEADKLRTEEEDPSFTNGNARVSSNPSLEADKLRTEEENPSFTNGNARVSSNPSLEADKLRTEEEVPSFTNGNAQVPSSPSLEADKLRTEEEVPRLKIGNAGLLLEVTQVRQPGQISHEVSQELQALESANLLLYTFPVENGAQPKEPWQYDWWQNCIVGHVSRFR